MRAAAPITLPLTTNTSINVIGEEEATYNWVYIKIIFVLGNMENMKVPPHGKRSRKSCRGELRSGGGSRMAELGQLVLFSATFPQWKCSFDSCCSSLVVAQEIFPTDFVFIVLLRSSFSDQFSLLKSPSKNNKQSSMVHIFFADRYRHKCVYWWSWCDKRP